MEQSNSTVTSEHQRNPNRLSSTNHAYANAEVSQHGEFRPFTPIYVNSDEESVRDLISERGSHHGSRTREGRGWSVGSSQGDRVQYRPQSDVRGWSAAPSQLSQVRSHSRLSAMDQAQCHLERVHSQPSRERRVWSAGQVDRVQSSREPRSSSAAFSYMDRVHHRHERERRGWSAGCDVKVQSPMEERAPLPPTTPPSEAARNLRDAQHRRAGRAKSVSATTRYKVDHDNGKTAAAQLPRPRSFTNNLSTVLSKPLPLPPLSVPPPAPILRRNNPHFLSAPRLHPPPTHTPPPPMVERLTPPRVDTGIETSGDYSTPIPVSERYKYDPKLRQEQQAEVSSVHAQPFFTNRSHDYSDPDELEDPEEPAGERVVVVVEEEGEEGEGGAQGDCYDHLTPPEVDIHPEGQQQVLAELEGLKDEPEDVYMHGYVPTEVSSLKIVFSCSKVSSLKIVFSCSKVSSLKIVFSCSKVSNLIGQFGGTIISYGIVPQRMEST